MGDRGDEPRAPAFHVVGLGASAGGLSALEAFFAATPPDLEMSFVVVQHLSPAHESKLAELLAGRTALDVVLAEDGAELRPGVVHVIPPATRLGVAEARLRLAAQPRAHGVNHLIDEFFRSLAAEFRERAVAIVLSGSGSDGALGIRDIKGAGGLVLAQDPETAQFESMPRAAIAGRVVDFVLPPADMPARLCEYARYPGRRDAAAPQVGEDELLARVLDRLDQRTGIDFFGYREGTLLRRIERRMQLNHVRTLDAYARHLDERPEELAALAQDVLIGVTRFFRDDAPFALLRDAVAPQLWRDAQARPDEPAELRVWSCACSTGEEAYSVAMLLLDAARQLGVAPRFRMFATDVDRQAIRVASIGSYPESVSADIPPELLSRYFTRVGARFVVNDRVRKNIIFSAHDVTRNPPFNRIDLLLCRNLLIYLKPEVQRHVLSSVTFALRATGFLLLGPSESLAEYAPHFDTIDQRANLFRLRGGAKPPLVRAYVSATARARLPQPPRGPVAAVSGEYEHRVFREVMEAHAPATVIVNDQLSVVMTFGPVHEFLRVPPGRLTPALSRMVQGTLGATIASALHKAKRTRATVEYRDVRVVERDRVRRLNLLVTLVSTQGHEAQLYALSLTPSDGDGPATAAVDLGGETLRYIANLEHELEFAKRSLQDTIEALETTNEELQSTNEELLTANEELQSTNEELQSVNEELYTVNAEHKLKITQLTESSDDFENLLAVAGLHAIFLDSALRVRRFSRGPAPFHLVEADIGRPIHHLALALDFPDFALTVQEVLHTLLPVRRVCGAPDGRSFRVDVVPYRTGDSEIRGAVVAMVDITAPLDETPEPRG